MTSHNNRRDPDSPSTSYKSSLDAPAEEDQLPSLTLVNPCHAAPASFVELQPFSSRVSRQGQGQGYQNTDLDGRGQVGMGIEEEGDHEKGVVPSQAQDGEGEEEEDTGPVMSKARLFLIASGMLLTYFLGTASSAAVTLMIPDIARSLDISELEAQWVSSAYTLAYGCGLLFAGRMSDMYGRKMLYLGGLSTFLIFSIISALIKNRIGLCVVRAICGLGLAVASPAGFGIVGVTFRKEPERTIAFAAFGLGAPLGAGTGTLIGGAIASTGDRGWTYLFYLLAGVALVPIIIGIFVIPKDKALRDVTQDRRIDWIGGFIVTAGLCLFCFSLTESGIAEKGWATPYVPTLLVLSVLLLVVFGFWERHLERNTTFPPIVKFSLFTRHQYKVLVIVISTFFIVISVYGFVYLITIFYQSHLGLSPLDTAIRTLPCTIVGCVAAGSVMWLGPRYKAPVLLYIGISVGSLSTLLFAVEPRGTIYWACQFIALCFLPWGIDFMVCLGNVMMSNLVEEDEQSVGGAIFQTSIQIGASLGICLASLVSTIRTEATGDLVRGLKDGFWMLTVFAWIVLVVVFFGLRKVGLARDVRGSRGSGKATSVAH